MSPGGVSTHLAVGTGDPSGTGAAVTGLSICRGMLLAGHRTRGAHTPVLAGLSGARSRSRQGRGGHRAGQAAALGPSTEQQRQQGQRGQQLGTGRLGAAGRHDGRRGLRSWRRAGRGGSGGASGGDGGSSGGASGWCCSAGPDASCSCRSPWFPGQPRAGQGAGPAEAGRTRDGNPAPSLSKLPKGCPPFPASWGQSRGCVQRKTGRHRGGGAGLQPAARRCWGRKWVERPLQMARSCHSRPLGAESVRPQRDQPDLILAGAPPAPKTLVPVPSTYSSRASLANPADLEWS